MLSWKRKMNNAYNPIILSKEMYGTIAGGADIRKMCRNEERDERAVRAQSGILVLMFKFHPLSLTNEEIWKMVNEENFAVMADGAFREYTQNVLQSKVN